MARRNRHRLPTDRRVRPTLEKETLLWQRSGVFVFGLDEAGRGCLAGPVCAAAYAFPRGVGAIPEVRDSKQIAEPIREAMFDEVRAAAAASGVGFASAEEIDRFNILNATSLALLRAVERALSATPAARLVFLTDGNQKLLHRARRFLEMPEFQRVRDLFSVGFEEEPVVKGDAKVASIAAASLLAKVSRDRVMRDLDARFPGYEFRAHKGYSTELHVRKLYELGPTSEHRRSFSPVKQVLHPGEARP
ncbi:MAG: ribonuclease HII [Bdellovibrionales bacterium]|nr:ribonuclease HII [Bdellovibrionales bacterium]